MAGGSSRGSFAATNVALISPARSDHQCALHHLLDDNVDVHTPKANVQCTTLDRKPLKSVRNRHQTNTILNTLHEPKSTTVLELKYRSYEMFTIIQEFTEKYRGFRGSLFSIHPLSGCERLHDNVRMLPLHELAVEGVFPGVEDPAGPSVVTGSRRPWERDSSLPLPLDEAPGWFSFGSSP